MRADYDGDWDLEVVIKEKCPTVHRWNIMRYHEITWTTEQINVFHRKVMWIMVQLINNAKLYHIIPLYLLNNDKDGQTKGLKPQEPHLRKCGMDKKICSPTSTTIKWGKVNANQRCEGKTQTIVFTCVYIYIKKCTKNTNKEIYRKVQYIQ